MPGVEAGAAGDDLTALTRSKIPSASVPKAWAARGSRDAPLQGVGDGPGLLEDLLEHVMAVLAALHRVRVDSGLLDRAHHGLSGWSQIRTPLRVISAMSPSSRKMNLCVTGSRAKTSDAMKASPNPRPMTSGLPCLVAIRRSGSWVSSTPSA